MPANKKDSEGAQKPAQILHESQPEKALGQRLQEARRTAGLTQQKLCQLSNLSYSTLAKIERGAIKSPSIFTIQSIANALGISLDVLLGNAAPQQQTASPLRSKSKSGVQFVFFDVNGCLVHFFHRAFVNIAHDTGATADAVEQVFWQYNDAVCRGVMSMSDFNEALSARIGVPSIDWEFYYLDAVEAIPDMQALVVWAAQNYRVGLITNTMPGLIPALRARGLLPDVAYEVIIDSSEVGAIKPDKKIYELAESKTGVSGSEILLVDDTRQNLVAAEQRGWHALWCADYHPEETVSRVHQLLE